MHVFRTLVFGACFFVSTGMMLQAQQLPFDKDRGEVYFRFPMPATGLDSMSRFISIDGFRQDTVFAYADMDGFHAFSQLGIPYQWLVPPSMQSGPIPMSGDPSAKGILSWDYYPTYPGYEALMAGFEQQYPSLCRMHDLGVLNSGRKILALQISSNPDSIQAKPAFLYSSTMHGDETVGYILLLRLADYLLSNYGLDPRITRLVDSLDIWISPLANPDGTYYGGNNTVYGATRFNAAWKDLNRNYPDPKAGPHPDNNPWQPETIIYMNLAQARKFSMGANIHGGAEVCNYPWDTWIRLHPDNTWWVHVCRQYADTAQFYSPAGYLDDFNNGITNGYAWYSITGGRQDYMNFFHQCREFTLEISNQKLPLPSTLNNYWNYNYRSLLNYMEQALYGLHGYVYDSLTGQAIEAKVFAINHDQDSSWVFSRLPHGNFYRYMPANTYSFRFSAQGYQDKFITGVSLTNGSKTSLDVPMVPTGHYLSGKVLYNNPSQTPMAAVWVYLFSANGQVQDSCQTASDGSFLFVGLDSATYYLEAKPAHAWGGVNSADALAIMKHFVQLGAPLEALSLIAADVNSSAYINASDALMVQKRFSGHIAAFKAPDWISETVNLTLSGNAQIIIMVQCMGDVDRSFVPGTP